MANAVASSLNGTVNGAGAGASVGGGWGALAGGILGGLGGIASGLVSSGGSSAAQMLNSLEKYYQPTATGYSWAQMENATALEQFKKQLATSAKQDLALSKAMNLELPSAQVAGLRAAGLNPILAVLGSGFSPIQSSASASMSGGAHLPNGFSSASRRVNSAGSAADFARILGGAIDAEVENRKADTGTKRASVDSIKAQTENLKSNNELIQAQADKTHAEAESIRDKIQHGSSFYSDWGREIRSGVSPILEGLTSKFLHLFGFGSPDAVKPDDISQRTGNSAKRPGIAIEVDLSGKKTDRGRDRYRHLPSIYDNRYNEKGE